MAGRFNLDDYEPVEDRLKRFWEAHPQGRVSTSLVSRDEKRVVFAAHVYAERKDMQPIASGYAEEVYGSTPVNRTSAVENCETSAIGRALSNANFASRSRASREEMAKVQRMEHEHADREQQTSRPTPPTRPDPAATRAKEGVMSFAQAQKLDTRKIFKEFNRVAGMPLDQCNDVALIQKFQKFVESNTGSFAKDG